VTVFARQIEVSVWTDNVGPWAYLLCCQRHKQYENADNSDMNPSVHVRPLRATP